jgi:gamma-glutamyl hydrolase
MLLKIVFLSRVCLQAFSIEENMQRRGLRHLMRRELPQRLAASRNETTQPGLRHDEGAATTKEPSAPPSRLGLEQLHTSATSLTVRNSRPIIGILTMPASEAFSRVMGIEKTGPTIIPASYVRYVESAGARVVPVHYALPQAELRWIFSQINGLLIPGGNTGIESEETREWRTGAEFLYGLALQENDRGHPFPVHGVCLGFELLMLLTAHDNNSLCGLGCFAAEHVPLNLDLTGDAASSKLFADMPGELFGALANENVAYNAHSNGIRPETFFSNSNLTKFWKVLSTSRDMMNKSFVSTVEAKNYPFSATQWHPEKNSFEWDGSGSRNVPHSANAVGVSWHMATEFVARARLNRNRFSSKAAEDFALIDQWETVKDPRGVYALVYMTGTARKARNSSHRKTFGDTGIPSYSEDEPLGLPSFAWHPMSIEIEFFQCASKNASSISQILDAQRLGAEDNQTVRLWLESAANELRNIFANTRASQALSLNKSRLSLMRSLFIKWGHDADDSLHEWNFEKEKTAQNLFELASPVELTEEEVKFAVNVSSTLVGRFTGAQESSVQAHVEARCLLSEDRLTSFLLLWEKYHDAVADFAKVRARSDSFAGSLAGRNPELLTALQRRLGQNQTEPLDEVFRRHAGSIRKLAGDRDGYRNFAVNVCHLINVDCCRNCTKNHVHKFGALEFRLFNTEFGAPLRLALKFFQRLVQRSCSVSAPQLHSWALRSGEKSASSIYPLLDLLELDHGEMDAAFLGGSAEKWDRFCDDAPDAIGSTTV